MKKLLLFFLLAYAISWLAWLPLYGPALGINGLPVLPYHHAYGAFGPLLAAFICARLFKSPSPANLARRMSVIGNKTMLAIAFAGPFVLAVLAIIISSSVNHQPIDLDTIGRSDELKDFGVISFILYNILTFGYGEETGWRGYALPVLQQRFNKLSAAVIVTLFWALWHLPLFLYRPGYTGMDLAGIMGWFFSLLTGSVLLSWLYNSSGGSILVCAVFHATVDVVFTSHYDDRSIINYLGIAITLAGIIVAFLLVRKAPKYMSLATDGNQHHY